MSVNDENESEPGSFSVEAERAYEVWLAHRRAGERSELEMLCRVLPGLAEELRRLHEQYELFRQTSPEELNELCTPDERFRQRGRSPPRPAASRSPPENDPGFGKSSSRGQGDSGLLDARLV